GLDRHASGMDKCSSRTDATLGARNRVDDEHGPATRGILVGDDELAMSIDRDSQRPPEKPPGAYDGLLAGDRINSDDFTGVAIRDDELPSRIDVDPARVPEHTA